MENSSISAGERIVAVVQRLVRERSITRPVRRATAWRRLD